MTDSQKPHKQIPKSMMTFNLWMTFLIGFKENVVKLNLKMCTISPILSLIVRMNIIQWILLYTPCQWTWIDVGWLFILFELWELQMKSISLEYQELINPWTIMPHNEIDRFICDFCKLLCFLMRFHFICFFLNEAYGFRGYEK